MWLLWRMMDEESSSFNPVVLFEFYFFVYFFANSVGMRMLWINIWKYSYSSVCVCACVCKCAYLCMCQWVASCLPTHTNPDDNWTQSPPALQITTVHMHSYWMTAAVRAYRHSKYDPLSNHIYRDSGRFERDVQVIFDRPFPAKDLEAIWAE